MPAKKTGSDASLKKRKGTAAKAAGPASPDNVSKIRTRAFELFMERVQANRPGDAVTDWLRAEEDIRSR